MTPVKHRYRIAGEPGCGFRVHDLRRYRLYSRAYPTMAEALALLNWLHERAAGYPKLDLPWHAIGCMHDGTPIPPPTLRTRSG